MNAIKGKLISYRQKIFKSKGVTLIELLVVITIMMTMMALVAPLAMNTVDKAEAQSEFLSFCGTLRRASIKAFANGSGIKIVLDKNKLTAFKVKPHPISTLQDDNAEEEILFEHNYQFLTFTTTDIHFNKNGISNLLTISFNQLTRKRELDLLALLEG